VIRLFFDYGFFVADQLLPFIVLPFTLPV